MPSGETEAESVPVQPENCASPSTRITGTWRRSPLRRSTTNRPQAIDSSHDAHQEVIDADTHQLTVGHPPGTRLPPPRRRRRRLARSLPRRGRTASATSPARRSTVRAAHRRDRTGSSPGSHRWSRSYCGTHTVSGSGPRYTPIAMLGRRRDVGRWLATGHEERRRSRPTAGCTSSSSPATIVANAPPSRRGCRWSVI